jgi:large subunit ribosomal protein L25
VRFEIPAESRDGSGRAFSRRLRREGRLPAIVYGGGKDPSAITLDHNSIIHLMEREAFYTSILTLTVGKSSQAVVVKAVHRHPAKPNLLHMDFQRVVEDEEITLNVPIHFIGEEAARGVKEQGGAIEHMESDVEISCLPRNLPEFLELDVSALGLNEILHLSDIKMPEGVTSVALAHGQDHPVVAIHPPRREETEEPVEGAAAEVPTVGSEAEPESGED